MTDRRHRRPLPLGGEDGLPFSKGLLARSLAATGISTDRAYELALAAEADIAQGGLESISFERLGELAREKLGEEDGATTMRRLHRFQDLYDLDLPVILLVGRRDRHRQVDRRHRRRLPARDHARHLDRLRPPDDASLLLA